MTQCCGLRVVDHENIVVGVQLLGILLVVSEVRSLGLLIQQGVFGPLQGIMQGLGDGEEPQVAAYHLPVGVDPQATDHWNIGEKKLGNPATKGRGVDVAKPEAFEVAGEGLDFIY
ncbi:hypothetical protein ES707_12906 [subsurface metagenome]